MRNLTLYTADTKLDFGKYKGTNLDEVLNTNPDYLKWCVEKVEWFVLTDEVLNKLLEYHYSMQKFGLELLNLEIPSFEVLTSFYNNINNSKYEQYELDNIREEAIDSFDYHDDRMDDMQENWLAYAAGTDDPETMNYLYWNLD